MAQALKHLALTIFACSLLLGISSCSTDGYSSGDFRIELVTVKDNGVYFVRDDGKTLVPRTGNGGWDLQNERALIDYTILDVDFQEYDYAIRLNSYLVDVLTKNVEYASPENQETQEMLGDDPLEISKIFVSGGYLNIEFSVNKSTSPIKHLISMVSAIPMAESVLQNEVNLELRHNSNGDLPNYRSKRNLVCFRLNDYRIEGRNTVMFNIKVKTFDGNTKVYNNIEYKYDTETTEESDPSADNPG